MNQNKEYEDMPVKEKKKKQELREAGMDVNGEFSMDSLKKWFRRAGGALSICAAAVCLMAVLMMGKNRKESLIMEVNSDIMMEFTMNRRGSVLSAKGMMARSNEAVSMTVFEGKSLGIAVGKIFDRLADNNSLGEDGGILISVRKSGAEVKASPEKIVKELQKQTESELQKKESRATVYVFESEEDTKNPGDCGKIWDHGDEGRIFKASFFGKSGDHDRKAGRTCRAFLKTPDPGDQ